MAVPMQEPMALEVAKKEALEMRQAKVDEHPEVRHKQFLKSQRLQGEVSPKVEFTNIKCISMDPEFSDFEYCYLKSVNRTYKYLSLKLNVFKVPVSAFELNFAVLKRFNGYRPFMYNITMDACRFLRYPKSNPVVLYIYDLFRPYSNLNHTCPYNHDIIVDKLSTGFINNHVTAVLPVPEGDYCLQTSWSANNILRSMITACGTLS